MLRETLKGTGVALITPFKKDKSIDFTALENLIEIQIAYHTYQNLIAQNKEFHSIQTINF